MQLNWGLGSVLGFSVLEIAIWTVFAVAFCEEGAGWFWDVGVRCFVRWIWGLVWVFWLVRCFLRIYWRISFMYVWADYHCVSIFAIVAVLTVALEKVFANCVGIRLISWWWLSWVVLGWLMLTIGFLIFVDGLYIGIIIVLAPGGSSAVDASTSLDGFGWLFALFANWRSLHISVVISISLEFANNEKVKMKVDK